MSEKSEKEVKGTLTITIENPDGGEFKYVIRPLDIGTYYLMQKILKAGKQFDAYVQMLKALKIEGDDPGVLLSDGKYLPCLFALDSILADMLEPVNASIKKN